METTEMVERIRTDFKYRREPFDDVTFPEARLLHEVATELGDDGEKVSLSMEDRLALLSALATFDYNRNANQLVDNLLELQKSPEKRWLDAWNVPNSEKEVEYRFKEIGFRYPSRDAHAWVANCRILRQKYHGKWSELLLSAGCDAAELVRQLHIDEFLCLKGTKIAPMYARIVSDHVCELTGLWNLETPVDTHIRKLSQELFDEDLTDDEIRDEWRSLAIENGVSRHVVDGGLWLIGNNWNDWGKEYFSEVTGIEKFTYI